MSVVTQRKREEQGAEGVGSLRVQAWCSSEPNKAGGVWSSAVNGDVEGDEAGGKACVCVWGGAVGFGKVSSGRGVWPDLQFQPLALQD